MIEQEVLILVCFGRGGRNCVAKRWIVGLWYSRSVLCLHVVGFSCLQPLSATPTPFDRIRIYRNWELRKVVREYVNPGIEPRNSRLQGWSNDQCLKLYQGPNKAIRVSNTAHIALRPHQKLKNTIYRSLLPVHEEKRRGWVGMNQSWYVTKQKVTLNSVSGSCQATSVPPSLPPLSLAPVISHSLPPSTHGRSGRGWEKKRYRKWGGDGGVDWIHRRIQDNEEDYTESKWMQVCEAKERELNVSYSWKRLGFKTHQFR